MVAGSFLVETRRIASTTALGTKLDPRRSRCDSFDWQTRGPNLACLFATNHKHILSHAPNGITESMHRIVTDAFGLSKHGYLRLTYLLFGFDAFCFHGLQHACLQDCTQEFHPGLQVRILHMNMSVRIFHRECTYTTHHSLKNRFHEESYNPFRVFSTGLFSQHYRTA